MEITRDLLIVGQQIGEDDDFITLKIGKRDDVTFTIEENDKFYTLLFVRQSDEGDGLITWHPFWHENPDNY